MCTLQNNVVLYIVATLLARLFHNVVKITFLQRYTTLYLRCVFAGGTAVVPAAPIATSYEGSNGSIFEIFFFKWALILREAHIF